MGSPALRIVFLVVLMDLAGFGLILPILPLYVNQLGGSHYFIGALLSIYSLMQFFASPILGRLSDRVGRRPIILLSITGSVVVYLVYGAAEHLSHNPEIVLWLLFGSRMLAGVMGGNIAAAQAIVSDVTTPENRAAGMGIVGAAIGLGFVLGPSIGALFTMPVILERYGLGVPGFAAAAISLANLAWAAFALPETLDPEFRRAANRGALFDGWRESLTRPGIAILVGAGFLMTLAFSQFESAFSLMAGLDFALEPSRIGLVFAYLAIIMVIMQGVITRRLVRRLGERAVAMGGAVAMAISMAGVASAAEFTGLLAWLTLLGIGFGAAQPAILAMLSQQAPEDSQGMTMGVGHAAGSLARIAGPALGLSLFGSISMRAPFWAAALFMLGVLLLGSAVRTVPKSGA